MSNFERSFGDKAAINVTTSFEQLFFFAENFQFFDPGRKISAAEKLLYLGGVKILHLFMIHSKRKYQGFRFLQKLLKNIALTRS